MKARLISLIAIVDVVLCSFVACRAPADLPRVNWIQVEGAETYDYSRLFRWEIVAEEVRPILLPMREGDLISFSFGDDPLFCYRYRESDGQRLVLRHEDARLLLGERTIAVDLPGGEDWFRTASRDDLRSLRYIGVEEGWKRSYRELFRRAASVNPSIGLGMDETSESGFVEAVLLLRPQWISLPNLSRAVVVRAQSQLENVDLLITKDATVAALSAFPNLRSVILTDAKAESFGPTPIECPRLRSLVLMSEKAWDMDRLPNAKALRELVVSNAGQDIGPIARYPRLESLVLSPCQDVSDLSVLKQLKRLTALGLPKGVTQDQFEAIVRDHRRLRSLEINECKSITSLSPVRELRDLETLVYLGEPIDIQPIRQLKRLRLFVLGEDAYDASDEAVAALRKERPDMTIVKGQPFCLGSGWILIVLPVVASFWLVSARRSRVRRAISYSD